MGHYRAIQTEYDGYRFRSRLEARWAVFFNSAGINYRYEPEGYELGAAWFVKSSTYDQKRGDREYEYELVNLGRYLPDFLLPDISPGLNAHTEGVWVEVKGGPPSEKEVRKAMVLAELTARPVLFLGPIPNPDTVESWAWDDVRDQPRIFWSRRMADHPYLFCQCVRCGAVGCEFDGRSARINCECGSFDAKSYNADAAALLVGYANARSARFEFGERPSA